MPRRFTVTEKWHDPWLHSRSIKAKLLWVYLCDVCDVAGFWEINLERAAFDTGISKRTIEGAFKELVRGYEINGRRIWLRNFLKYQGNLPLNPNNPAHKGIISLLQQRKSFSDNIILILEGKETKAPSEGLQSPISKGNGKSISNSKGKYSPNFLLFWKGYPERWIKESDRYVKLGKYKAWVEWKKLTPEVHKFILSILPQLKTGQYVPDAWRWLRDKKWHDYTVKPKPQKPQTTTDTEAPKPKPQTTKQLPRPQLKTVPEAKTQAQLNKQRQKALQDLRTKK